ncbi:MAG: zf-HC2 domain-containing protein [Defluviitaleaceae bacterium]|nr:zf-HC2 domain-containing protein [Defluviitaleaceae bacterium]
MIKCDVIQDLIPLYSDAVASDGSRALVDEHLKSCTVCAEILTASNDNNETAIFGTDNIEINALRKIKRKILKKITVIGFSAAVCTAILIWIVFTWRISIPFDADNITVHPVNTIQPSASMSIVIDEYESMNSFPILDIRNNYSSVGFMQIDDELFVRIEGTFYTRFLRQSGSGRWFTTGDPNLISLAFIGFPNDSCHRYEIGEDINRIYYMHANYNRLFRLASDDATAEDARIALDRAKRNAVLVWER